MRMKAKLCDNCHRLMDKIPDKINQETSRWVCESCTAVKFDDE